MKRFVIFIMMFLSAIHYVMAQDNLAITPLFNGRIVPMNRIVEMKVKGKALSKYKLTLYRSVKFVATGREEKEISLLIHRDKKNNANKEQSSWQNKDYGRYALTFSLLPEKGHNRFLCYLKENRQDRYVITVVYLEGTIADVQELTKLIRK